LLSAGGHGQTDEILGQANVCIDPARVVVEVQEGARFQLEDSLAPLAKRGASTELLEKRRYAGEGVWTSVLHLLPSTAWLSGGAKRRPLQSNVGVQSRGLVGRVGCRGSARSRFPQETTIRIGKFDSEGAVQPAHVVDVFLLRFVAEMTEDLDLS